MRGQGRGLGEQKILREQFQPTRKDGEKATAPLREDLKQRPSLQEVQLLWGY